MAKPRTFTIGAIVKVWVDVSVKANSLEEALEASTKLTLTDFVTFPEGYNDGSYKVIGVHDPNWDTTV